MSLDASRTYVIPIERLADAFAAADEIAPRRREPRKYPILLPDGSSVDFGFSPDRQPPYVLEPGDFLSFDYAFRVGGGDDVVKYLREDPEPPFQVKRLKSGGIRLIVYPVLLVSAEPPYASFGFHNRSNKDCDVFTLRSVCDVLDYIGRCADGLAVYETVMGEDRLVQPFEAKLPPARGDDDEGGSELARVVEYVRAHGPA